VKPANTDYHSDYLAICLALILRLFLFLFFSFLKKRNTIYAAVAGYRKLLLVWSIIFLESSNISFSKYLPEADFPSSPFTYSRRFTTFLQLVV